MLVRINALVFLTQTFFADDSDYSDVSFNTSWYDSDEFADHFIFNDDVRGLFYFIYDISCPFYAIVYVFLITIK